MSPVLRGAAPKPFEFADLHKLPRPARPFAVENFKGGKVSGKVIGRDSSRNLRLELKGPKHLEWGLWGAKLPRDRGRTPRNESGRNLAATPWSGTQNGPKVTAMFGQSQLAVGCKCGPFF